LNLKRTPTQRKQKGLAACAALVVALALAGPASPATGDPPDRPDDVSAVDAYRESLPTSSGPRVPSAGAGGRGSLASGVDEALAQLATSSDLGAPRSDRPGGAAIQRELRKGDRTSFSGALAAGSGIGSGPEARHLLALVLLVAATTAFALVAAGRRHRRE
jgi:hypothetical protein